MKEIIQKQRRNQGKDQKIGQQHGSGKSQATTANKGASQQQGSA